jgi:hypothetical protein
MRMKFAALACGALLASTQTTLAAPIHALLDPQTGIVEVRGLTGEIYISLRGPDEKLNRAAAAPIAGSTLDNFVPGEVTYLNLGGFNGSVSMGPVAKVSSGLDALRDYRFAWQSGFTGEIVEWSARDIPPGSVPPIAGGFWIVMIIPEPTTFAMAGLGVAGMLAFARRLRPLSHWDDHAYIAASRLTRQPG